MSDGRAQLAELLRHEDDGGLVGWCDMAKGLYLYDAVCRLAEVRQRPLACVEVGVWGGRSLVPVALALRDRDAGHVLGLDPYDRAAALAGWENAPDHRDWILSVDYDRIRRGQEDALDRLNLRRWAGVVRSPAEAAAHLVGEVDLLHVDGNHAEAAALRDVRLWLPKVAAGGLMVLDDSDWNTVQAARRVLRGRLKVVRSEATWEAYRRDG